MWRRGPCGEEIVSVLDVTPGERVDEKKVGKKRRNKRAAKVLGLGIIFCSEKSIHAIDDKASDMILDMYESVAAANGDRDRRLRIEHAQHLAPGSADRFGQLYIVASVQVNYTKLGFGRAEKEPYLFQSLLNGKALVAFGSDWPVSDINSLNSIRTAVKRIPPNLFASHLFPHLSTRYQRHLGSLSPGKLADFVVLSTNSWDEFSKDGSASVLATYVGGKQMYP
ncbi:hypothetical protein AALP_AA5G197000 [Arabis alpina]|uniref:Amidohydrolase 3 domain-containing protein n=1 Tax=Arabis alpina TaxID=50452 RepID=A0A087GY66_ARAAL|nr:hypothetical protein AALP_AA5G197000 [Arabis alpina]